MHRTDFFAILFLVLLAVAAAADPVVFQASQTGTVNVTASNNSLQVQVPGQVFVYGLGPTVVSYVFPITLNQSVNPFNVSVEACAGLNETVLNSTQYLERVIREQLVPNQEQYNRFVDECRDEKLNMSSQCSDAKQEIMNQVYVAKVELNSTRIGCELAMNATLQRLSNSEDQKQFFFYVILGLIVLATALLIYLGRGFTWKTFTDSILNMRDKKPMSRYPTGMRPGDATIPPKEVTK
jgi:hypothetical protein